MEIEIPNYTESDFDSTAPYEFLYSFKDDAFLTPIVESKLAKIAAGLHITNFKSRYKGYLSRLKGDVSTNVTESNVTVFTAQPLELDCGQWYCDDDGIYINGESGKLYACPHPIMPTERLVNIDTLAEKLTLGYSRNGRWKFLTVGKEILASASKITELAAYGISVNSDNAKLLSRFITDIEARNYDYIPEKKSVSRMGYIESEGVGGDADGGEFEGETD